MVDWDSLNIEVTASCANALAALDSMMDDMPDILLTDVRMPGMNGLELIEQALMLYPQLQTIILSANSDFDYARQAMKNGVKEYLLKPCSSNELEETLKRTCFEVDNNPHYFSQVFRKYTGMTPTEYRASMEKATEK